MDVRTWRVWDPLRPHVERIARTADAEGIVEPTTRLTNQLGRLRQYKALFALLTQSDAEIGAADLEENLALLLALRGPEG